MRERSIKTLINVVCTSALLATVACSGLRPFRVKAQSEPQATPASNANQQQALRPELPLALGRDDDYVVRIVVGAVWKMFTPSRSAMRQARPASG